MKAALRKIRISPKKANLVAGMVRGKNVNEALALLKFMPKKGADIIYKVVHSAAYNAKNNFKQNIDDLVITKILVTKGPTYKRSQPISRGRAHPIRKRTAHITVEVGMSDDETTLHGGQAKRQDDEIVKKEEKHKKDVKKETPKAEPKAKESPKMRDKKAKEEAAKKTIKKTEKK